MVDRILITSTAVRRDHPEMVGTATIEIPWIHKPFEPEELLRHADQITRRVRRRSPVMRSFR
jgi:hypothetical protein